MAVPLRAITEGIDKLGDFIGGKFTELKDAFVGKLAEVKTTLTEFKDSFVNKVVELKDAFVSKVIEVKDSIVSMWDTVKTLPSKFRDMLSDLFHTLFVPKDNFFDAKITDFKSKLDEKLPFVGQLIDLLQSVVRGYFGDSSAPVFEFSYGGVSMPIVDFSLFDKYNLLIKGILAFVAWYFYASRLLKRLPGFIGGFHS